MCKKYKLIEEYPGSPEIGVTAVLLKDECYQVNDSARGYFGYMKHTVENNPKFWKLVEEPKFQILSYYAKNISGKGDNYVDPEYIWTERLPGKQGQWAQFRNNEWITGTYTTEEITNHNGYGIHSVKRLSDGEVFTIGDKIKHSHVKLPIVKFENLSHGDLVVELTNGNSYSVDCISKLKDPLLTTEDGVEIFEGGEFWEVFDNYSRIAKVNFYCIETFLKHGSDRKTFSTKEKAEEFIEKNTKKYSLIDIEEALSVLNPYLGQPLIGSLKLSILIKLKSKL